MNDRESESHIHHGRREKGALSHKLDAIGWGLFFIWMGIALLLDVGWGWGMVGIAVIILGEALIRKKMDLNVGGFWVVVGLLFLAGGLWELLEVQHSIAPFAIIAIGVAVLWGAFSGKHIMKK
jgi:hypothetical protein